MLKCNNRIVRGDALEVLKKLPDNCMDAGVTSPPYNKKERQKGWLVKNVVYDGYRDALPEGKYQENQVAVLDELYRVIRPGGSFFYNHKIRWVRGAMLHPMQWLVRSRWPVRQEIVWDRGIAANIRGWRFWAIDERLYWLCKPAAHGGNGRVIDRELPSRYAKLGSIWRIRPEQRNPHPAPFPLALPARALAAVLDSAPRLVIDPYAGSGTTLLAAKLLGHGYFGIDMSRQYCDHARKRLKNPDAADLAQFAEECARHRIRKTFRQRKEDNEHVGRFRPKKRAARAPCRDTA